MKEEADHGRDVHQIYKAFHGAAVRFGERHITSRNMSNGRKIYYPASWDEPEHRTLRPDQARRAAQRDARLAEIKRIVTATSKGGDCNLQ